MNSIDAVNRDLLIEITSAIVQESASTHPRLDGLSPWCSGCIWGFQRKEKSMNRAMLNTRYSIDIADVTRFSRSEILR
jgi:hypothetical protein